MPKAKVTVIIASLNSVEALPRTILSVARQDYIDKELIIIDGGSTDGTVELLKNLELKIKNNLELCNDTAWLNFDGRKRMGRPRAPRNLDKTGHFAIERNKEFEGNQSIIFKWQSRKDKGISDAFNKGVKAATGDFILFLGAGDYLTDKNVLTAMMAGVNPQKDILVCGRIKRVANDDRERILYISKLNFKCWRLIYKMALPHQALFTNKQFFDRYGLFDLNCKFAMDYDLLLRAYHSFPEVVIKDVIVAAWRAGGVGEDKNSDIFDEYKRIRLKHRVAPPWLIAAVDRLARLRYCR